MAQEESQLPKLRYRIAVGLPYLCALNTRLGVRLPPILTGLIVANGFEPANLFERAQAAPLHLHRFFSFGTGACKRVVNTIRRRVSSHESRRRDQQGP
jgi:hypothetical protein